MRGDSGWYLVFDDDDPSCRRTLEALLALGDGGFGVRGSREELDPYAVPLVLADGVYAGIGEGEHLMAGPWPLTLDLPSALPSRWVLDLRSATLARELRTPAGSVRTLRFLAAGHRGLLLLRVEGALAGEAAAAPLVRQVTERRIDSGVVDGRRWARTIGEHGGIAVTVAQRDASGGNGGRAVERVAAFTASPERAPAVRDTLGALLQAEDLGFDRLLADHRRAWERRWDDVDVEIPDDPDAQLAARFALFHLWNSVCETGEAAVGARGMTGGAYAGHVFWDTDVFVLPAVATMSPRAAKAILRYRLRRLPQARRLAAARGLEGARYPWESATLGDDVTPPQGHIGGEWVPILTGQLEEHIVGDVAWAAAFYADWSGDDKFLAGQAQPLLLETARYWASRIRTDPDGTAHINHVIGPDEYHPVVDDNCYTNVLARGNLRRAAALDGGAPDARRWRELASRLVDGYDADARRHEQFAGFSRLEPVLAAEVAPPPFAADVLLGSGRVARSQLVKQPDVLMAHHLLPDEMRDGSLGEDVDYYLPRTTHGSSLSPAITAAVLARAGRPDAALPLLRVALRLDLDDLTGMTAGGLHLGTMGGVWQAIVFGFAGISVRGGAVSIRPQLPAAWSRLRLRVRCLGRYLLLDVRNDEVTLRTNRSIPVHETCDVVEVQREVTLVRRGDEWRVKA